MAVPESVELTRNQLGDERGVQKRQVIRSEMFDKAMAPDVLSEGPALRPHCGHSGLDM